MYTKAKPDSSHRYPVTRDNRHRLKNKKFNFEKRQKTLWWWPSTRKGGAGMSWNLHSLRYSKQNWTQPCSACSEQGSWTRWSSEVSPNHSNFMILWSYNYLHQAFDIRPIACSHRNICTFLKICSQYWYVLSHLGQNCPKWILQVMQYF